MDRAAELGGARRQRAAPGAGAVPGGLCVLATNRKLALDKALERRIAIKVEFERPDRESCRKIWQKMLPAKLPLAEALDLERLADEDLSGSEIRTCC